MRFKYKKEINIILRSNNPVRLQEAAYDIYIAKIPNKNPDDKENYVNATIQVHNETKDD